MNSFSTPWRTVSLQDALDDDDNVLARLRYPAQQKAFWGSLAARKAEIESLVRYHLGVSWCSVCAMETWKAGSFNVVVPVLVRDRGRRGGERVYYVRFPLPYKVGEADHPGNVEEKLRSEIATYIWLQENCPDVPIPNLHGFCLPGDPSFSHPRNTPVVQRIVWWLHRRFCTLSGSSVPSQYVRRGRQSPFDSGYMILSEAKGSPLAISWEAHRHDNVYRQRLFRSLARIQLSMDRVPLPRIGSLRFDEDGVIALSNRPLSMYLHLLENEGIPSGIPRQRTYASTESYLSDLLSFQDNKLRYQPNSIHDRQDGEMQLAALTALRSMMHLFIREDFREGPFYYTLTDLQQHNIFVDDDWNIQTIIDLEWARSQPMDMQLPPYWLTSRHIDSFDSGKHIHELGLLLEEYFGVFEAEELARNGVVIHSPIMRQVWNTGSFWYFHAVTVPKGMYRIFNANIQPLFNERHCDGSIFDQVLHWYWGPGVQPFIQQKIKDNVQYNRRLKSVFREGTRKVG